MNRSSSAALIATPANRPSRAPGRLSAVSRATVRPCRVISILFPLLNFVEKRKELRLHLGYGHLSGRMIIMMTIGGLVKPGTIFSLPATRQGTLPPGAPLRKREEFPHRSWRPCDDTLAVDGDGGAVAGDDLTAGLADEENTRGHVLAGSRYWCT